MACRGVFLVVLVCAAATATVQGFDLMDSLTLKALMRGNLERHEPKDDEATTKEAIYDAMLEHLNEILINEPHDVHFDLDGHDDLWPIFAPGGEYGPKYDVMNDEYEDDMAKRSNTEIFVDALTKKDLESLLHQPDPSLTVQELPLNPRISFRKGLQNEVTTVEPPTSPIGLEIGGEGRGLKGQGMKEEATFLSPSASWIPQSPFSSLMEAKQLRSLAMANKKNY